jgi:hypothetical protein
LCGHTHPPPLPPPHHSQELAGGGSGTAVRSSHREQDCNRAQKIHPSTLPIWRTASSIRLVSASQNALNSG